jgi:hypothetical protein
VIGCDYFFVFQKIGGEVPVTRLLAIEFVRIGVIADEVAGLIPGREQFAAVGFIDAHPANEKRGPDTFVGNRFQDSVVGFLPSQDGSESERRIIEREGELGPRGIVGGGFWQSAL